MTHPTDDELEAMAKYHDWREDGDSQTAAMLRACKTGDAPSYLAGWNDAREAAAKVVERCDWGHHWNLDGEYADPSDLSDAIRALTPPERPKP